MLAVVVSDSAQVATGAVVHISPPEPIMVEGGSFDPILFDLDADDIDDLAFHHRDIQTDSTPLGSNRLLSGSDDPELAAALQAGDFIGADPGDPLQWTDTRQALNACVSGGGLFCVGNFRGGFDYLGVEFEIGGQTHYGWVQIESVEFFVSATIIDWAYESDPGRSILAGQIPEPSAVLLVLASVAAMLMRRQRGGQPHGQFPYSNLP